MEEGSKAPQAKPKPSKQERRAIQDAQRAKKAALAGAKPTNASKGGESPSTTKPAVAAPSAAPSKSPENVTEGWSKTTDANLVSLFAHLPEFRKPDELSRRVNLLTDDIHPCIIALGLKYANGSIRGANARCVAMLLAFKTVVGDYVTPPEKAFATQDLDKRLRPLINFLTECRPKSISMGNAIKFVRKIIANVPPDIGEEAAKATISKQIDTFIRGRIQFADKAIVQFGLSKIVDGDVILTYARSSVVELLLQSARQQSVSFRVIIIDSRPMLEGRQLLERLAAAGVQCTYCLLSATSFMMREVTKVFLGAAALMSNGAALARAGTAIVAMTARSHNVPVLFCCETYKFCERVQLDSICSNELGDPEDLAQCPTSPGVLDGWRDTPSLQLLNVRYDITPMKYISMAITEVGMLPPTSVPVVIREYHAECG